MYFTACWKIKIRHNWPIIFDDMQQVLIFHCVRNDDWPIQDDTTIFRISFPATLEGNKGKIVQKTVHIPNIWTNTFPTFIANDQFLDLF